MTALPPNPSPADIIAALGGRRAVAEAFGVSVRVVHDWTRPNRGFPGYVWHQILALAERRGVPVTIGMLERKLVRSAANRATLRPSVGQ